MNVRRLFTIAVLSFAFAASASSASGATKGTTDGTFDGIEQGHYAHLLLKNSKAKQESFFIRDAHKSVESYLANPKKLKGRKVRVHWEDRDEYIPEASGKQRVKVVTKVEQRS